MSSEAAGIRSGTVPGDSTVKTGPRMMRVCRRTSSLSNAARLFIFVGLALGAFLLPSHHPTAQALATQASPATHHSIFTEFDSAYAREMVRVPGAVALKAFGGFLARRNKRGNQCS